MVMCAFGKAARTAIGNQDMSIEAAVVGIVDRVDINDTLSDEMREAARRLVQREWQTLKTDTPDHPSLLQWPMKT